LPTLNNLVKTRQVITDKLLGDISFPARKSLNIDRSKINIDESFRHNKDKYFVFGTHTCKS